MTDPSPMPSLSTPLAELAAWKQAQAAMMPRLGVNPQRRLRRALAQRMGVSPKTLRKLAKRHTRETKAQIAALRAAATRPNATESPSAPAEAAP